jgi:hypothetical protein
VRVFKTDPKKITHPNAQPRPDDALLLDWLVRCADNEGAVKKILVDNPEAVYGFSSLSFRGEYGALVTDIQ